ncbi:MAG: hydroxymethylbilane synthase [Deltaproteobacteria bacterium]
MNINIGTRGSALALWQARHVASLIEKNHPEARIELIVIKTQGDKLLDSPLALIGGKGLFTKEIEEALLDRRVDLAVHSMKDLPTLLPDGLKLAALLEREDPRDVFVSRDGRNLEELGPGSVIGTSSLRRKAFLLNRYPELEVTSIRGNVDTRLRKIETEGMAGIMLAAAGVKRMGFADRVTTYMDPEVMIPAIGQGALGIEIRAGDPTIETVAAELNHEETAICVGIERSFLATMGGGCQVPMSAYAIVRGDEVRLTAAIFHPDGNPMIRDTLTGSKRDERTGVRLAEVLMNRGGAAIVKSVLGQDWLRDPEQ